MSNSRPVRTIVLPLRKFFASLPAVALICGGIAYFAYSIPALSQAIIIALLCLLWLSYLHRTLTRMRLR